MKTEGYQKLAKLMVDAEKELYPVTHAEPAIIIYKGKPHVASIQQIIPGHSDVVLCAHSSYAVDQQLIELAQTS